MSSDKLPLIPPKRGVLAPKSDPSVLSEEDRREIEAQAKETVAKRRLEAARKQALAAAIEAEERGHMPDEELISVTINLAEHSNSIRLDGKEYFHNFTYKVPRRVFVCFQEVMYRTHAHEDEIKGRGSFDRGRRPRAWRLTPGMEGASYEQLLRV